MYLRNIYALVINLYKDYQQAISEYPIPGLL